MELRGAVAVVTGGVSGMGEATARMLLAGGAKVCALDLNEERGKALEAELGGNYVSVRTDVTDEASVTAALNRAVEAFGAVHIAVNCAGIAAAAKVLGREGPMKIEAFQKVLTINVVGTMNVLRLAAAKMLSNTPNAEGERGVIVNTASVAAFDGQIGQAAYSASKGAIVAMTLPIAREFAEHGIRVMTIAPGIIDTPMMAAMPEKVREALGKMVPFPPRLGRPEEFAMLARHIVENPLLNGEVIRLDGAIRMQAR